jgi:lauroyl/myristoyl acyltransferase
MELYPASDLPATLLLLYGTIFAMSAPNSRKLSLLDSRRVGELGLYIGQVLPLSLGYCLSDSIAAVLAVRRSSAMVRAVRANQWRVRGEKISGKELDRAVRETLRNVVRSFYLLFHYLDDDTALRNFIVMDAELQALADACKSHNCGILVLGIHMSYFDLALHGLVRNGLHPLALTLPQGTEAIEWQHELRRRSGLEILPASIHNLRLVIKRLEAGGMVTTGVDRPMCEPKVTPLFFGKPANVPVHYIQLALKANVPVRLLAPIMRPDGRIQVLSSGDIEMQHCSDRQEELVFNARRVLEFAESVIVRYPQQWGMTWPVWPDIRDQVP